MDKIRTLYIASLKRTALFNLFVRGKITEEGKLGYLINRIVNCITHREKFNLGAYMSLRKAIMKKMYIVAHLEWRYEE